MLRSLVGSEMCIRDSHLYDNASSWVEEYHQKLILGKQVPEFKEAPKRLRRLTIDEAAILQTFPETYEFLGPQSKIFSQIGNAVPCKLARVVASAVKLALLRQVDLPESPFEQSSFNFKAA